MTPKTETFFKPSDEQELHRDHVSRVRRLRKIMRYLPRRSRLHKYPVLKWFGSTVQRVPYLWSFREEAVVRAFYAGWILSLLPLMGVQLVLAVGAALIFRANLPVLAGLQMISTPITVPIIYYVTYKVGSFFMVLMGADPVAAASSAETIMAEFRRLSLPEMRQAFSSMALGGAILGYFAAFLSSLFYQIGSRRAAAAFQRLRHLRRQRRTAEAEVLAQAVRATEQPLASNSENAAVDPDDDAPPPATEDVPGDKASSGVAAPTEDSDVPGDEAASGEPGLDGNADAPGTDDVRGDFGESTGENDPSSSEESHRDASGS